MFTKELQHLRRKYRKTALRSGLEEAWVEYSVLVQPREKCFKEVLLISNQIKRTNFYFCIFILK